MLVRATKPGFFVGRRRVGDQFEVPDSFKASWVEVVDVPVGAPKPQPKKRPGTLTLAEGGKQVGADLGNADLA